MRATDAVTGADEDAEAEAEAVALADAVVVGKGVRHYSHNETVRKSDRRAVE